MSAILETASISLARRLAAGAWQVPAGFVFLLKRPQLWALALLPALLAVGLVSGGFVLGLYAAPTVEAALTPGGGRLPPVVSVILAVTVWIATLTAGLALGLAAALLLGAPLLDKLSRETERLVRGDDLRSPSMGALWEVKEAVRGAVYFMAAAPGIFVLGLIPVVGPVLGALWAARALSFQLTDPSLGRRGLAFAARRAWHRTYRAESLGFGLTALILLLVPCANFLLVPALVVGATRLVLDLKEAAVG